LQRCWQVKVRDDTRVPRLDSIAPELRRSFQGSPSAHQRAALAAACSLAVESSELDAPFVAQALGKVRDGTSDAIVSASLRDLAEQLDQQYLALAKKADDQLTPTASRLFSRARAADALRCALSPDDSDRVEAIYEALMAIDDVDTAVRRIQSVLA
jgi:hypothetical protein